MGTAGEKPSPRARRITMSSLSDSGRLVTSAVTVSAASGLGIRTTQVIPATALLAIVVAQFAGTELRVAVVAAAAVILALRIGSTR